MEFLKSVADFSYISELRKWVKGWMAGNKGLIPGSIIPGLPPPHPSSNITSV